MIFNIQLTNIRNNEIFNITFSDKIKNLYDLNKQLTVGRRNGFKFNQINELTIKIHSHLRYINISYYLKFPMPLSHRHFFRKISQNREEINNFGNDLENDMSEMVQSIKLKFVCNFIISSLFLIQHIFAI